VLCAQFQEISLRSAVAWGPFCSPEVLFAWGPFYSLKERSNVVSVLTELASLELPLESRLVLLSPCISVRRLAYEFSGAEA
jgi:hypothetical protein